MVVKKLQQEIISEFEKASGTGSGHFDLPKYLGTKNKIYHLKSAQSKRIAKDFIIRHKVITSGEFLELLNLLYSGESFNERVFGTTLLAYGKLFKPLFTPERIFGWLSNLSGWCEVDSLCQSTFEAKDILNDGENWEKIISKMSTDRNISRRRASLVLLTKSVRVSDDDRLSKLAFANLDKLKGEKDILITKAVSWLLRSLIKHHKAEVSAYLEKNRDILPKIAIRETERKLATGRK